MYSETEGNPVVELLDEVIETAGSEPSDDGHHALEEPEEEGNGEEYFHAHTAQDDTAGDGHREAVHRKADGQKPNFKITHVRILKR